MRLIAMTVVMGMTSPAWADTLRCKNALISVGATQGFVAEKCGEPDSKATLTEPIRVVTPGGSFLNGTASRDVWRYRRGSGKFPAVLTFEEGVLRKLEFEK